MRISVVTVCYNAANTIGDTLDSVRLQDYPDIEHVVIDGGSRDGTAALVQARQRPGGIFVSEPDQGIYDAMNKGIARATGDVIALLNADDMYSDEGVVSRIVSYFQSAPGIDAVLGDVAYIASTGSRKIIRRYRSDRFNPARIAWGWMPAHPAMVLTRNAYRRAGQYRTDFRIAGDYEFVARAFGRIGLSYRHVPDIFVLMRMGGLSTSGLNAKMTINRECVRACRENGIYTNLAMIMSKYPLKLVERFV